MGDMLDVYEEEMHEPICFYLGNDTYIGLENLNVLVSYKGKSLLEYKVKSNIQADIVIDHIKKQLEKIND